MPEEKSPEQTADEKILATSKKRFDLCAEAEKDQRTVGLDDLKFRAGEQWPIQVINQRNAENRPCLTINVIPARERQILNDQRQNRQAIKVSPVGEGAEQETAEIIEGIVRHIEYDSNADIAYDTASACQLRNGWGYIRLITVEEDGQQEIKIRRVPNPFQIYMDPSCQEADYSDAKYAFVFDTLTKEEFEQEYPDAELCSVDDWNGIGDKAGDWISEEGVRIVEYFYIEPKTKKVKWVKHNGYEILERTDWQGKWIPIVPVLGDEIFVDGKRSYEGLVRWAKDPIRMKNFASSALVETISLAPKAPWLAKFGQTEDFPQWKTANTQAHDVLVWKSTEQGDTAPVRLVQEPAIQAIGALGATFDEAIRDVMGIYEAQYGARSQEKSGKAIIAKKQQGEIANFHYQDNLTRAVRFLGRQIVDLIRKVYNTAMVRRIIGQDGAQKLVQINQKFQSGQDQQGNPITKIYDLRTGKYDLEVKSGSYQSQREEAVQMMVQFAEVYPKLAEIAGDLIVGEMDFHNAQKIAERIKKTLPPNLADDDQGDPKVQLQQAQAQMSQMGQQIDLLSKANSQMLDVIQQKQVEQEGKREIAEMQEKTKILVAEITTKAQESQLRLKMEQDQWLALHGSADAVGKVAQQAAHDQASQQSDQQHESDMQGSDQAHQSGMADQQAQIAARQADQGHQQTLEQQQQAADLAPEPATSNA